MAKKPAALGRGLGALLGGDHLFDSAGDSGGGSFDNPPPEAVHVLSVTDIENNAAQPRKQFDPEALEQLADSIRQHGLLQPLAVRKLPSGYYQIIAGERRWRAARMAGLNEVPVIVLDVDDQTAAELAMVENLQREDLNPMEEAAGYRALIDNYHMTQEEVAERVGKSRSAVANALRLLDLSAGVQAFVEDGRLSAGHARALITLSEPLQKQAADVILNGGLSVRQTEALAKQMGKKKEKRTSVRNPDDVDYTIEAQKELSERLGRGVRIVTGRKKGRIELDYYGLDDLNELLDALGMLGAVRSQEGAAE